jgi:hypothetical protein
LEKLHVVAPENGFRHPVGYGLVYVAMSLEDLQPYLQPSFPPPIHAQRQRVSPSSLLPAQQQGQSQRRPRQVSPADELSLYEALLDPAVNAAHERSTDSDETTETSTTSLDDFFRRAQGMIDSEISETHSPETCVGDDLDEMDPWQPPITISNGDELGPEDATSEDVIAFRNHRERLARLTSRRSYYDYSASQPQHEAAREYLAQQQARDEMQRELDRNRDNPNPFPLTRRSPERFRSYAALRLAHDTPLTPPAEQMDFSLQPHDYPRHRANVPSTAPAARAASHANPEDLTETDRLPALIRQQLYRLRYGGPTSGPFTTAMTTTTTNPSPNPVPPRTTVTTQPSPPPPPPRSHAPPTNRSSSTPPSSTSSSSLSRVTFAYFTMTSDQRKVTLNFSPEVSGKFILLTLWSDGRGNDGGVGGFASGGPASVDVQSVVAMGFGGMRFFAAQEVR